jgi:hypothetical protein
MNINYNVKIILNTSTLEFLRIIIIDNTLSLKSHVDMISPKLNQACYIITVVKPFLSWDTLEDDLLCLLSPYYDLWDNIFLTHCDNIFKLQKELLEL